MTGRYLDAWINEASVGRLQEQQDLWSFEYAAAWAASPLAYDLSPALPRRLPGSAQAARHNDGATRRPVQWFFDNLLPEEALRTVIAGEASIAPEDAFGMLAWYGAESAGALVLRDPADNTVPAQGLQPLSLDELSRRISALPRVSLSQGAPKRMSLAGAQHKMLVVVGVGGALFEPLPGTPSTHILKPDHPGEDYPASVMNEFFTMRLAARVGLAVAPVQRRYVPQPVYLVQRFDRQPAGTGDAPSAVQRLHAIDSCQLLDRSRLFKYSAASLQTLVAAVALCRYKAAARLQLYRWLVFNLLVGNGDNHLKNLSFLVDAAGIRLAPAYDLLSTAVYDTPAFADDRARWPATALAWPLEDAATFGTVSCADVLRAGVALGLAQATAARELDRLVQAVPAAAERLVAEIEATAQADAMASPDPVQSRRHVAGELRLLRAIRHIVIPDMVQRLAAAMPAGSRPQRAG